MSKIAMWGIGKKELVCPPFPPTQTRPKLIHKDALLRVVYAFFSCIFILFYFIFNCSIYFAIKIVRKFQKSGV